MQSNLKSVGQRRSFIEEQRRSQIVDIAIQTIATQGFSQASLAEIAKEAGISKGVISYHFADNHKLSVNKLFYKNQANVIVGGVIELPLFND